VRAEDTVARLGGDEFIILLEELCNDDDVTAIVEKLIAALIVPITFEGRPIAISTSIGISLYPDDGAEPQELIKNADAAMYQAKEQGRNAFQMFSRATVAA